MAAPGAAALGAGTAYDLRDAVEEVYAGGAAAAVAARHSVDRRRITELVSRLPPGLLNDPQRLSLRRAANTVAQLPMAGVYTEWELKEALTEVLIGRLTKPAAHAQYGPASSTLRRHAAHVRAMFCVGPQTEATVRALVSKLTIPSAGAKPYFEPAELALLIGRAQEAAAAGAGITRAGLREQLHGMAAEVAATLPVGAGRTRLEEAQFSGKFMRRAAKVANEAGLLPPVSSRKTSAISAKRAAAASPVEAAKYANKVAAKYVEWRTAGFFTGTQPTADQVFNADEVGTGGEGARQQRSGAAGPRPRLLRKALSSRPAPRARRQIRQRHLGEGRDTAVHHDDERKGAVLADRGADHTC